MFTADSDGVLKQIDTFLGEILKDYGKIHDSRIQKILATYNTQFLFTTDETGCMKQFSLKTRKLVKDYGKIFNKEIDVLTCTHDSEYQYITGNKGHLKQINIRHSALFKYHGRVHKDPIKSVCCSKDGKWFFTGDSKGKLKQFSCTNFQLIKDYEKIHNNGVNCQKCSVNNLWLISGDSGGNLKQFNIKNRCLVKDFGMVWNSEISFQQITLDSKSIFVSNWAGNLVQFPIFKNFSGIIDKNQESKQDEVCFAGKKDYGTICTPFVRELAITEEYLKFCTIDVNGEVKILSWFYNFDEQLNTEEVTETKNTQMDSSNNITKNILEDSRYEQYYSDISKDQIYNTEDKIPQKKKDQKSLYQNCSIANKKTEYVKFENFKKKLTPALKKSPRASLNWKVEKLPPSQERRPAFDKHNKSQNLTARLHQDISYLSYLESCVQTPQREIILDKSWQNSVISDLENKDNSKQEQKKLIGRIAPPIIEKTPSNSKATNYKFQNGKISSEKRIKNVLYQRKSIATSADLKEIASIQKKSSEKILMKREKKDVVIKEKNQEEEIIVPVGVPYQQEVCNLVYKFNNTMGISQVASVEGSQIGEDNMQSSRKTSLYEKKTLKSNHQAKSESQKNEKQCPIHELNKDGSPQNEASFEVILQTKNENSLKNNKNTSSPQNNNDELMRKFEKLEYMVYSMNERDKAKDEKQKYLESKISKIEYMLDKLITVTTKQQNSKTLEKKYSVWAKSNDSPVFGQNNSYDKDIQVQNQIISHVRINSHNYNEMNHNDAINNEKNDFQQNSNPKDGYLINCDVVAPVFYSQNNSASRQRNEKKQTPIPTNSDNSQNQQYHILSIDNSDQIEQHQRAKQNIYFSQTFDERNQHNPQNKQKPNNSHYKCGRRDSKRDFSRLQRKLQLLENRNENSSKQYSHTVKVEPNSNTLGEIGLQTSDFNFEGLDIDKLKSRKFSQKYGIRSVEKKQLIKDYIETLEYPVTTENDFSCDVDAEGDDLYNENSLVGDIMPLNQKFSKSNRQKMIVEESDLQKTNMDTAEKKKRDMKIMKRNLENIEVENERTLRISMQKETNQHTP